MFETFYQNRKVSIAAFLILASLSAILLPQLKFAFNFEQFFPQGDEDLEFFQEYIKEFETDDNFLLVALDNKPTVFDTSFLRKVEAFSKEAYKEIPYVKLVQSLPNYRYPVMTPFGPTTVPALHLDKPEQLKSDSIRLMKDERVLYNLLNLAATSTAVVIKTDDNIQMEASDSIMEAVYKLLDKHELDDYHLLGRAYFQSELAKLQFKEIMISTVISGILVCLVMILIFKKWASIFVALSSIGVGLMIFMGFLALLGRELSVMAALYPILMLIVGTSDVIHIMSKYHDELRKGNSKRESMRVTIKQIGLATLLTSLTTAAGFATLLSSRIGPIQEFGVNSAIGVLIAYVVVIGFTCPMLSLFSKDQMITTQKSMNRWSGMLSWAYKFSIEKRRAITMVSLFFLVLFGIGISKIHTNYDLYTNLPTGEKISEDFLYFEKEYAGFRPLELAGTLQGDYKIYDHEVISAVAKTEDYLKSLPEIQTAFSMGTIAKSLNQMLKRANESAYVIPEKEDYSKVKKMLVTLPSIGTDALISKDKSMTRISSKIKDVGAENIKVMSAKVDDWLDKNIDPQIIQFEQTGTGLLLDKNSEFVKDSLIQGLLIALAIVSLLMGLLFRNWKMLLLALVPNLIPLLFAAALLGFTGVALEAGISIVFAIIFGIAVDDTIHFLSKYKLAKDNHNGDTEKALEITFQECGKAIIFTSIILFFGFLVLLFSSNQPSVIIGLLISVTLISALVADLTILPVLIRKFKI